MEEDGQESISGRQQHNRRKVERGRNGREVLVEEGGRGLVPFPRSVALPLFLQPSLSYRQVSAGPALVLQVGPEGMPTCSLSLCLFAHIVTHLVLMLLPPSLSSCRCFRLIRGGIVTRTFF